MSTGSWGILCVCLAWTAITAPGARADAAPAILSAWVDYDGNRVTLTGSNFSPHGEAPTVAFDTAPLTVVSYTDQSAAASLPAGWSTGSYLLAVTNSEHRTGEYRMTLAAPLGKLSYHARALYEPWAIAGSAAYAGLLQEFNAPREWGQGWRAYGKRVASTEGAVAIHTVLAFGLDSALHEDPRYFRSGHAGLWRRLASVLRGTVLTHTDQGGETFSTWRFGSAYGAAFLSNLWYPDRLDTVRLGFIHGSVRVGFDLVANLGAEFWPDIKKKLRRRG